MIMWTDIKNDQPDTGTDVLVVVKRNQSSEPKIKVGYLLSDSETWVVDGKFDFDLGEITHWKELPDLPN